VYTVSGSTDRLDIMVRLRGTAITRGSLPAGAAVDGG
jgi:hypothetical protein